VSGDPWAPPLLQDGTPAKTPCCPQCGWPPGMVLSPGQATCPNEDCGCLMWAPNVPAAAQLGGERYEVTLLRDERDLGV
jgi:hypothetical protein